MWYKGSGDAFPPVLVITESAVRNMEQILFGKYAVTGLLGAGANGQVYLARHQILEQDRAIKRISKSMPDSSSFRSEAELLKSLKHPGIPIIYDIEEDDEYYYMIEEYVRGESLEAYVLHQTTISLNFILQIGRQLCDIMGYLHTLPTPVIYQDLKPEHIIVYGDQIKIVDFGIASYISIDGNPYQSYGTARYAAPEKRLGLPCDERTDIYGIGVVLRFLEQFLPPEEHSARLSSIIDRAMAEEKEHRFETAALLMAQLEKEIVIGTNEISEGKKHLYKNLAVVGMRAGIGATHVAISYSVYLNETGDSCLYVEQNHSGDLRRMADSGHARWDRKTDGISCGSFLGTVSQRKGREWEKQGMGCLIRDFGTYESSDIELETCDGIVLVLGGREWEMEQAERLYERLRLRKHLVPIVNYGNEWAAKYYARHWRRNVYCFPADGSPFTLSTEKRQFFDTLQHRERW